MIANDHVPCRDDIQHGALADIATRMQCVRARRRGLGLAARVKELHGPKWLHLALAPVQKVRRPTSAPGLAHVCAGRWTGRMLWY